MLSAGGEHAPCCNRACFIVQTSFDRHNSKGFGAQEVSLGLSQFVKIGLLLFIEANILR